LNKVVHIAIPISGVGVYIKLLTAYIDNNQFKNVLLCNKENEELEFLDKSNFSITKFHIDLINEIDFIRDVKCLFQIIKLLRKIKPNLIHCHSAKAGILGRLAGFYLKIPTLYTPHAFSYLSTNNRAKKLIFKNVEKLFRFLPSSILACSNSEYYRAIYELKFKKRKTFLWNNSIEKPKTLKLSNIKLPNEYICSAGRPSFQKNLEMLIEAIFYVKKSVKNVHLVLLGSGSSTPYLLKIEKMIEKRNLENNIRLVSWLKREEALRIINDSVLYLSSSRYEGLPYSIIESLSLSKPCIVTNVDGNKDLVKDNYNGFLIDINDSKTMANKIISIFKNKEELKRMSNNARSIFLENYDIEKNISKLEEIYLSKIS